jgi:outer membrane protein TolC
MRNYLLVPVLALSFVMFPAFSFSVQAQSHSVLSLDDCIRMGLEGNLMLQMQRLQLASASADVQIASAVYDTRVQLDGTWQDSELPPGSFPSQGGVERGQGTGRLVREFEYGTQLGLELDVQRNLFEGFSTPSEPVWRTAAGLTLRQSLWNNAFGASDRARVDYVRQQLESLNLDYERAQQSVVAQVADYYWRALIARQVADAQSHVAKRLGLLLESNKRKVEDGLLDEIAVLAVDASLAVADVDQEALRFEALSRDEMLKEKIDLPSREWDSTRINYQLPDQQQDEMELPSFIDVYENAIRYRADLEALRREEKRVESLIRLRQMEDRSDVEVSGGIGRGDSGEKFDETLDFDKTLWSVGIMADISLSRSATRASLTQAYLERDRIRTEREMLERSIDLECRTVVRQVATARRLVSATRRAFDAQKKKLELEVIRMNRGQSDTKTLLDYENDRDLAERDHLRSLGAQQQSLVSLELVQGILPTGETP